ncbi:MAG: 3'-5' exonuclease [Elusimicrobiota bacterium]
MKIGINTPIENVKFVIVDVETTGLDPENDRICEIAISALLNFREVNSFSTLINPGIPIPKEISRIHGITDDDVSKSPHFSNIINRVLEMLYDGVFVGHNVDFDYGFINAELARWGYTMPDVYRIDTLKISRKFCNNIPNNKLETVARSINLFSDDWHRAENDVQITRKIFEYFLRMFVKENQVIMLGDLLKITG